MLAEAAAVVQEERPSKVVSLEVCLELRPPAWKLVCRLRWPNWEYAGLVPRMLCRHNCCLHTHATVGTQQRAGAFLWVAVCTTPQSYCARKPVVPTPTMI